VSSDYVVGTALSAGLIGPRYAGRYRPSGHPVALEEIPHALLNRPDFVRELSLAGRSAARLADPHIVAVHDVVRIDGRLYIVTELVRGRTLATMLGAEPSLPLPSALLVTDSVLAALEVAHTAGVVHGDVCPDCVGVEREGAVRLSGLGLAAALAADRRMDGWPAVAPPEGGAPGVAADLYACGALLRELVTGLRPEQGGEEARPVEVEVLIARAVAPAPEQRFSTAAEFRAELRRVATEAVGPDWETPADLVARVARPLGLHLPRPRLNRTVTVAAAAAAVPAPVDEVAVPAPPTSPPPWTAPLPGDDDFFALGPPPPDPGALPVHVMDGPPYRRPPLRAPVPLPRSRHRWPLVTALVAVLLVAAAAAVLVSPLSPLTGNQGPLRVGSDLHLAVQPSGTGGCHTTFTFTATATVTGTGTLLYRWEQAEAGSATEDAEYSVRVGSSDGSFRLTRTWSFAGDTTVQGSMTFRILSPQAKAVSTTVLDVCGTGT
jgi:serine/threonine-protein kinase